DDRLAHVLDEVEDMLAGERVLAAAHRRLHRQLVDVGAGDERFLSRAGQYDDADVVVPFELQDDAPQLVHRLRVQRVENLGPVDGDDRDRAVALEQEVVESHRSLLRRLQRERIHQPAEHEGRREEPAEHQAAEPELIARIVFGDDGEDERDEKREDGEKRQVALHHLRPMAMSKASMTTSRLSSPATIRNALPYS